MRAQGLRRRKRKGAPVIREIITDEEILSKPCDAATAADAAIADDLVETLLASDEAVCLAANQIGETKRIVAYLNEAGRPQVMYNPRVTQKLKPYTLLASDEAVCLAANQIGETKRIVAYLNEAGRPQVMYNPRVTQKLKPYTAVEACLSREEPTAVTRYDWVRVSYEVLVDGELVERKKKIEGNAAQAVQHMIDHCEGILV